MKDRDFYWAASPADELPQALTERARAFWDRLDSSGRLDLWRRIDRTYYGLDGSGGWGDSAAVRFGGDAGETVMVRVNEFRSIIRGITSIVTAERPAFSARANNGDAASLDAAPLCEGLVTSYYETGGLEDVTQEAAQYAIRFGEGHTHLRWDAYAGRVYTTAQRPIYDDSGQPMTETVEVVDETTDPLTGLVTVVRRTEERPMMEDWPEREGDLRPAALPPYRCIRDLDASELVWCLVPHEENVWTLAARYPEKRAELVALRGSAIWPRRVWETSPDTARARDDDEDMVTTWCFYHLPCDALPHGRYAIVAGDLVLYDGPMTMRMLPVVPLIPERQTGTAQGDTPVTDLLCLQEIYDAAWSTIVTQVDAHGISNVAVPEGQDIQVEILGRGSQLLKYEPNPAAKDNGLPTPIRLLDISPELWRVIEQVPLRMQVLSGINSVTRGAPDTQIKSGNFAALVSAQAQSYNGPLSRGIIRHHERVGSALLEMLRTHATTQRIAEVGGRDRQLAVREFRADELTIERVSVDVANPLTQQMAGRLELAQLMLSQPGLVQTPEQLFQLLATGRLEPLYRGQQSQLTLIKRENELLADGKRPPVFIFDRHDEHMTEHAAVIADPLVRTSRPDVIEALTQHMLEHLTQLGQLAGTPAIALALNIKIPPQMATQVSAPMPGQVPQGAPPTGGPPPGGPMGEHPEPGRAKPPGAAPGADLPFMPTNPATGRREVPAGATP
jgi:hypothetical protein